MHFATSLGKPSRFLLVSLLLAAASTAQVDVCTPSGYLSTEGEWYAYRLGAYPEARYMRVDGELRGAPRLIDEIAHRFDYRSHSTSTAMGRTFTNVSLRVAHCDFDKLTRTFAAVPTTTPALVFSQNVTWPSVTGRPLTNPAMWASTNGSLRFPFKQGFVYTGAADLCLDFDFSGGTLANNSAWGTSTARTYYLDGYPSRYYNYGSLTVYGLAGTNVGCVDSGTANNIGGLGYVYAYLYGPNYATTSYRNLYRIYSYSYYTATGKPLVWGLSLGGKPDGVGFPGVSCNKLFLDLSKPTVTGSYTTSTTSTSTFYEIAWVPYGASLVGIELWWQGAWLESTTNQLMFTRAARSELPPLPVKTYRQATLLQVNPTLKATTAQGIYDDFDFAPLTRYRTY
ncbi:MAG: hypothetical protein H6837_05110 [Planctomycetes bacterium]|nr:hypothetical protein [Planctomycetota bacterium]